MSTFSACRVRLTRRVSVPLVTAIAVAGLCSLLAAGAGPAVAVAPSAGAGGWDKAIQVPGTAALSKGRSAEITSVSCAAAGSCAAGGDYADGPGRTQAFVVTEAQGRWGTAIEVPGTAALNVGGDAATSSVSCGAAGSCAAGGYYIDSAGLWQPFVVTEAQGRWGTAIEVPGMAALHKGGEAETVSVSCAAAGSCAAGGFYTDSSGHGQAFVVTEAQGLWGTAIEVPGTAALNKGGNAITFSVSCAAPGSCAAGGFYTPGHGRGLAFVVTEAQGQWGTAVKVPGTAALSKGGGAGITSVSCAAAGSCAAGGFYGERSGQRQAFVVTEAQGRWGTAIEVPGTAALNKGGNAVISSVSCAAAGSCAAGGSYADGHGHGQAFVVTEAQGRWRTAVKVPGTAALNKGGDAATFSVSCAAAGSCAAGGSYAAGPSRDQVFVVNQVQGRWRTAVKVPGTAALNKGAGAAISSVSCAGGGCAAGGDYLDGSFRRHAFVVSKP